MTIEPIPHDAEYIPNHELIVDISETTLQLISALRIQREPDISRAILTIDVYNQTFTTPDFVIRNIAADSRINELVVDATINHLTNQASLSIRLNITVADAEDMLLNIDAVGIENEGPDSALLIEDTVMPCLEPVDRAELNRFLASLFIKNKTGDYSAFDPMDLSNATTTQRLIEALQEVAIETIQDETYFLSETMGLTTDSLEYVERNGEVVSATVSMEHHAKASILELTFPGSTSESNFELISDDDTDESDDPEFLMQKREGARTFTQDVDGYRTQVASTNDFLIVLRDFVKAQSISVFTAPAEKLDEENTADITYSMNIEDSRSDN